MKKFDFRLEPVLRLRQLRADAERARLRELTLQQKRMEGALEALKQERAQAAQFVYTMAEPTVHDLRSLSVFNLGADARSRQMAEAVERAKAAVSEARRRVLVVERDELILEKMRAKRLKEWQIACEREIENSAQELWGLTHTKAGERPQRSKQADGRNES